MRKVGKAKKIHNLRGRGYSAEQIAAELGCSARTIQRTLAKDRPTTAPAPTPADVRVAALPVPTGGPLLDRVQALYELAREVRDGLDQESALASAVAADIVGIATTLSRLERRAARPGFRVTRTELEDAVASVVASINAVCGQPFACEACGRIVPGKVIDAPSLPARTADVAAADASASRQDELVARFDAEFDRYRALAGAVGDPKAQQKFLRQSGRLAALLARAEQTDHDVVVFDDELVAQGQADLQAVAGFAADAAEAGPLLCAGCAAEQRYRDAESASHGPDSLGDEE